MVIITATVLGQLIDDTSFSITNKCTETLLNNMGKLRRNSTVHVVSHTN
jgi:hypothetical protein